VPLVTHGISLVNTVRGAGLVKPRIEAAVALQLQSYTTSHAARRSQTDVTGIVIKIRSDAT